MKNDFEIGDIVLYRDEPRLLKVASAPFEYNGMTCVICKIGSGKKSQHIKLARFITSNDYGKRRRKKWRRGNERI